jgi:hypothetical protein
MQSGNRVEPLYDLSFLPGYVWVIIIIAVLAVFLTALYFIICGVTALRGWQSYGSRYRGQRDFPAGVQTFSGQSMMIGGNVAPANYRHVVTVGYDDQGIYLRMGKFFRPFHPPVFVPWSAVNEVEQKKAIKGFYTAVQVSGMSRLVFFRNLGDEIQTKWQNLDNKGKSAA